MAIALGVATLGWQDSGCRGFSKDIMQIEGPDGQLPSMCQFVTDYKVPLWRRDIMWQWESCIEIPKTPLGSLMAAIVECPTQKLDRLLIAQHGYISGH